MLTSADVHVATALGRLGRETDERVLLAVALAVRAVRGGSVCVDLATVADPEDLPWPEAAGWAAAVAGSPLVEAGLVRWENGLLYLDRYHEQESQVLDDLLARAATSPDHDAALMAASLARVAAAMQEHHREAAERDGRPLPSYDEQVAACLTAAGQWTTVLTGGPGTGKTTAVASLLVGLLDQHPGGPAHRAGRADRQGRGPAPAGGAPGGRARSTRPTGCGWPGSPPRRCTGCCAPTPATPPASATTAATGSRTTWSWSTSRRWCR